MLEPCRVFLLRHGLTDWNAERRLQGQLDLPLNAVGLRQADQLGQALAGEDIAAIYSSDLLRARQTATPLAQALALPVHTDPMLRERHFGRLEGLSYQEIDDRFPQDARGWRQREPGFAPGGGETLSNFFDRAVAVVARLAAPHVGESIALFSHGGVLDCLYRAATGLDLQAPRSWQMRNASINRVLYTGSGFVLVGWDDHAHLEVDAASVPLAQQS
jgi:probable phosphoglycerate mutase